MANLEVSPIRADYATTRIQDGFAWREIMREIPQDSAYVVVFRSKRRPDADVARLTYHDEQAHEEAKQAKGLIHYFKGEATEEGDCLSFCIWESAKDAREASQRPKHQEATRLTGRMYKSYSLERYNLRKDNENDNENVVFEEVKPHPAISQ